MNAFKGTPGSISTDCSLITVNENQGTLFCKTLLPAAHKTVLRGGPNAKGEHAESDSYEYLDGTGKQWSLDKKYTSNTYLRQQGNYRVEIIPTVARTDDVFLHVLHPSGQSAMPRTELARSADGEILGASVDGWCVLFSRSGAPIKTGAVALPQPLNRLLLTDLAPRQEYEVQITANSVTFAPHPGGSRASEQGTLFVEIP
jgi:hypothetical protein